MRRKGNSLANGFSKSIFLAITLFVGIRPAATDTFSPSFDTKYKFITSMFSTNGTLHISGTLRYDKIVRWEKPIRIAFRGEVSQKFREELLSPLDSFSGVTPLKVVHDDTTPNFVIVFIADEGRRHQLVREALVAVSGEEARAQVLMSQLSVLRSQDPCTMGSTNNGGRIQIYVGAVSTAQSPAKIGRCIELLAMAGVGFQAYDMSDLYNRVHIEPKRIKKIQIDMVRILYSEQIYPGQPFEEVKKILIGK